MKEWGEENFIRHLADHFSTKSSAYGIGDDCAVIPSENDRALLVTTDALVEGVHFIKEQISATDLGYKTIAVNVSDVAAMGGIPHYAFLAVALPKETEHDWLCAFADGMKQACDLWNIQLLGGDTVGSKRDLFVNLTLIGSAKAENIKYRHSAKSGDILCVTGNLGDSAAGFKALQTDLPLVPNVETLIEAHFRPQVNPSMGAWLAEQTGVHAMMDLSDGLDCDLRRLIKSSKCGASIEITQFPLSTALREVSDAQRWDSLKMAISGGEDYVLLCSISSEAFPTIQGAFEEQFGSALTPIGRITAQVESLNYESAGEPIFIKPTTFDHFE